MSVKMITNIQDVTVDDVMSVYSGRANTCCCGCAGKHTYNSKHIHTATRDRGYKVRPEEVCDRTVKRILNWMKRNAGLIDMVPNMKGRIPYNFFSAITENGKRMYIVYMHPRNVGKKNNHGN